jgi:endoglucanase
MKFAKTSRSAILLAVLLLALITISGDFSSSAKASDPLMRGVNLSGAEFGSTYPGVYNKDYTYPTAQEYQYYGQAGQKLIRLPFRWERIQLFNKTTGKLALAPDGSAQLVATEMERLQEQLYLASQQGMKIVLDMHNYARYTIGRTDYIIDANNGASSKVTANDFKRVWQAITTYFYATPDDTTTVNVYSLDANGNPTSTVQARRLDLYNAIWGYGLMNEPHDMPTYSLDTTVTTWWQIAQAGINGVRAADPTGQILVAGDDWSSAMNWTKTWGNTNSAKLQKYINDPKGPQPVNPKSPTLDEIAANLVNIRFEAHQYFDRDGSGTYRTKPSSVDPNLGTQRLQPFADWLNANHLKGYIGEFGVPKDQPIWWTTPTGAHGLLYNFYDAMANNGYTDASGATVPNPIPSTYWAGGPWWGTYILSVEPTWNTNNQINTEAPVMVTVIKQYPSI